MFVRFILERRRRLYDSHSKFWKFGCGWYNR